MLNEKKAVFVGIAFEVSKNCDRRVRAEFCIFEPNHFIVFRMVPMKARMGTVGTGGSARHCKTDPPVVTN